MSLKGSGSEIIMLNYNEDLLNVTAEQIKVFIMNNQISLSSFIIIPLRSVNSVRVVQEEGENNMQTHKKYGVVN